MSEAYDWYPMPHLLDIKCPHCSGYSIFEFSEIVKINEKKDVPFFQENSMFEYQFFEDYAGQRWHGAIFNALLHGGSTSAIRELPKGYSQKDWEHSKYLTRNHRLDWGAYRCNICHSCEKCTLQWPEDAYFSIEYKNQQLWAFNRESFVELKDYIQSHDRAVEKYKWRSFLLHIPTIFKKQAARDAIVKKMNKALAM